jgi:uncharacterized protein DUF6223
MNRTFVLALAALAAAVVFAALVHAVLVAAHLSEPAATTVQGLTIRRLWASTAAVLALVGVGAGGTALARPAGRLGIGSGRLGVVVAFAAGLIALVNGAFNLALAKGGPGTGNGVVGAAAALVLGLIALGLGTTALTPRLTASRLSRRARIHARRFPASPAHRPPRACRPDPPVTARAPRRRL